MYDIFFIHSYTNGLIDCLFILSVVCSAAINRGVQTFLQGIDFVFFGYLPSSGIAGL